MRIAGHRVSIELLQWVGLLGAGLAWAAQHIAGIALTLAQCNPAGRTWQLPLQGLTIAVTAVAATVAATSLASAIAVKRAIDRQGDAEQPPAARLRFLAVVGITVDPLLLCIILMSGTGVVFHHTCQQS